MFSTPLSKTYSMMIPATLLYPFPLYYALYLPYARWTVYTCICPTVSQCVYLIFKRKFCLGVIIIQTWFFNIVFSLRFTLLKYLLNKNPEMIAFRNKYRYTNLCSHRYFLKLLCSHRSKTIKFESATGILSFRMLFFPFFKPNPSINNNNILSCSS